MTTTSLHNGVGAVTVPGGQLVYETRGGSTEPVLAIHGISSQRRLWNWLHAAAPEITLIAPDLRGRADSYPVAGPSSIARHADDMIALLDSLEIGSVHVCGMSMGGFVAMEMGARFKGRVKSLTLIDGGFPMAAPAGLTRDMLPAVFADRLARLEQRWDSVDDYLEFFVKNTAPLLDRDDPLLRDNLSHDLRDGRVRLSGAALLSDAADITFDGVEWESVDVPIRFLHAQWSVGPDSPPGYPAEVVDRYREKTVLTRYLEGVDHAGTIMTAKGAAATADLLSAALA